MDVKGAKALSERLAEAARTIDPTPAKAADSAEVGRGSDGAGEGDGSYEAASG